MKKTATLEECWQEYASAVQVPLGGAQWRETRRAFYSGIWAFMHQLRIVDELAENELESVGVEWMLTREKECQDFITREIERSGVRIQIVATPGAKT